VTRATVLTSPLHRVQAGHGRAFVTELPSTPPPAHRPARVAVMLALAHKIEDAIAKGVVQDQAEAARRLGLTRARLTQLLRLPRLAPDLQEHVLFLEATDGVEPLTERALRAVTRERQWAEQRVVFDGAHADAHEPVRAPRACRLR
jgi:hypothetical protein